MSKLDFGHLPVISNELVVAYLVESEGYMEFTGTDWGWTQTAVDFSCLVTGTLFDRIKELEAQLVTTNELLTRYQKVSEVTLSLAEKLRGE